MKLLNAYRLSECLVLETTEGMLKLEPRSSSVIHVVYTKKKDFSRTPSLIVLPGHKKEVDWAMDDTDTGIILSTGAISIHVDKGSCAFTYRNALGDVLAREPRRGGKVLEEIDVLKPVHDSSRDIAIESGVDGIRSAAGSTSYRVDRKACHARLDFEWADGEALYGLGSHEEGVMNLRGSHQYLYQQNMKAVVPVLLSTMGYGILMDSCSLMTFHDDAFGSYLWCDVEDELDYYFIHGPEFDDIIRCYRGLTGQAPMLPRWAFGYVQSKERYRSQEELCQVVREYRRRRIPLDLIVLDWKSWTGDLWGQKTLDPERFPDPDAMVRELHSMGARLMVSIWPNMMPGGPNHTEMKARGFLLGNQSTYDAFDRDARALYWKQMQEGLFSHGIDAWWCDCTEPFEADWKGAVKPEPEERMLINTAEAKKYMDPERINAYSLLHAQGIYEGQRQATDRKRVVNLTRSSYAGQHRYATITWSGDIAASWETMKKQIPAGLNFCATGEPYWTLDIGAFFVGGKIKWSRWCSDPGIPAPWFLAGDYDDCCDDLGYRELFVRWFQYGAFLPMFRVHGTDTPKEVWQFGEPGSLFHDTLVKFIHLRYRLLPYVYTLAGMVTHRDYTMMRALAFDFRHDDAALGVTDQYMFGPAIMVCPVTDPMYYGSGSVKMSGVPEKRNVYLPEGCDWYDFWTGEKFKGGQNLSVPAPLGIMPLFIRSGSLIPMGPLVQHTGEGAGEPLELWVYPGANGDFAIYEDEGDGYDYEKGAFSWTRVTWDDAAGKLTVDEPTGTFRSKNSCMEFHPVVVSEGHGYCTHPIGE